MVRTAALDDLKTETNQPLATDKGTPAAMDRPLGPRERRTLLIIIAALAELAEVDLSKPAKAGDAIERQIELLGEKVSSRRIQDHINRAREELRQDDNSHV